MTCSKCSAPIDGFDALFSDINYGEPQCIDREGCALRAIRETARRDEMQMIREQLQLPGSRIVLEKSAGVVLLWVAIADRHVPLMMNEARS